MKILNEKQPIKVIATEVEVDPIEADLYPMPVGTDAMRDSGSNVVPDNGTQAADVEVDADAEVDLETRQATRPGQKAR